MMMSLFSVFDPMVLGIQLNWLVMMFPLFMLSFIWMSNKSFGKAFVLMLKGVSMMFKEIGGLSSYGLAYLMVVLFMLISMMNSLGLIPFIFTPTSHPIVNFSLSFTMWVGLILMGWIKFFIKMSGHLVPEGSPLVLSPFLVLVELVSHIIRPFTLAIRLAANMMAGHLILGLLSSISVNYLGFFMSLMMQSILLVLELGVAFIQGFVFSILMLLYLLECY